LWHSKGDNLARWSSALLPVRPFGIADSISGPVPDAWVAIFGVRRSLIQQVDVTAAGAVGLFAIFCHRPEMSEEGLPLGQDRGLDMLMEEVAEVGICKQNGLCVLTRAVFGIGGEQLVMVNWWVVRDPPARPENHQNKSRDP
jgi:hypothetical protein